MSTILARLSALETALAAHGSTVSDLPTADEVAALDKRIMAIEAEIGSEDDGDSAAGLTPAPAATSVTTFSG